MRRKLLSLLTVLSVIFMLMIFTQSIASADVITSGYLKFNTNTGQILSCNIGASGELVIPSEIDAVAVTSIADEAFKSCRQLTKITIPNSVTQIGDSAFRDCELLTELVILESVTSMVIGGQAFSGCSSLQEFVIPNCVTKIGARAFNDCSSLKSIEIPESVTSINDYVFEGCSSLKSINIPDSVTDIGAGYYMFNGCTELESITIGAGVPSDWALSSTSSSAFSNLKKITLNGGQISNLAGANDIELIIGKNISDLSYVISEINRFKSIEIDKDNPYYYSTETAVYNKDKTELIAYLNVAAITDIELLPTVKKIDNRVFYQCENLEKVYLPNGLKEIGKENFYECPKLTKVVIPDSVSNISSSCFYDCENLQEAYVGKGLANIGSYIFMNFYSGSGAKWSSPNTNVNIHIYKDSVIDSYINKENSRITIAENQYRYTYIDGTELPTAKLSAKPTLTEFQTNTYQLDVKLDEVEYDSQLITIFYDGENIVDIVTTELTSGDMEKSIFANKCTAAKVFIWDSLTGMRPLCASESVTVTEK